jgi:predicted PilT family ATPase
MRDLARDFSRIKILGLSVKDWISLSMLYEGLCILGSPGSGKSGFVGARVSEGLLREVP